MTAKTQTVNMSGYIQWMHILTGSGCKLRIIQLVVVVFLTSMVIYLTQDGRECDFQLTLDDRIDHIVTEPDVSTINSNTVLVFIQSSPLHREKRMLIRNTWGDWYRYNMNKKTILEFHVIFILGSDYATKNDNNRWSDIENEIASYKDILLLNMRDQYDMLTIKGLYTLNWIVKRLPMVEYVVKTDDDVFLNIHGWLKIAESLSRQEVSCCIVGYVWQNAPTQRGNERYAVAKTSYAFKHYPSFCSGMGYLMTRMSIQAILEASSHLTLFYRDDPFFTGIAAYVASVPLITIPRSSMVFFESNAMGIQNIPFNRTIMQIHNISRDVWIAYWKQMALHMNNEHIAVTAALKLSFILENYRILTYLKPKFQLDYTSLWRNSCSKLIPSAGTHFSVPM